MTVLIIRAVFVLTMILTGGFFAESFSEQIPFQPFLGGVMGGFLGIILIAIEKAIETFSFEKLIAPVVGLILGLVMGSFIVGYVQFLSPGFIENESAKQWIPAITILMMIVFGYFGLVIGMASRKEEVKVREVASDLQRARGAIPKVLDTSVIIDGRIAEISEIGFLEGALLVPRFVLKELQNIADSADSLKRARGRRGLEILNRMQGKDSKVDVQIYDLDFPEIPEVDAKLVRLSQILKAKVVTNDFNLSKVAQIEGIEVLNINDLANALKPQVLPDEEMVVKIIKEGKEAGQGIGYLDDGTMIVIEGGMSHIGEELKVIVTSVLQTSAGRNDIHQNFMTPVM